MKIMVNGEHVGSLYDQIRVFLTTGSSVTVELVPVNTETYTATLELTVKEPSTKLVIGEHNAIAKEKDVDGFHPQSVGALSIGQPGFVSCTPAGIIQLLKRSNISIEGKECVVIGRSNIVGRPMHKLLLDASMNVTVLHTVPSRFASLITILSET